MMLPIKEFMVIGNHSPSNEELMEAKNLAVTENCVVNIKWFINYNGWNNRYIYPDSDIDEVINEIRGRRYAV